VDACLPGPLQQAAAGFTYICEPRLRSSPEAVTYWNGSKDGHLVGHSHTWPGCALIRFDSMQIRQQHAHLFSGQIFSARSLALELTLAGAPGITIVDPWDNQASCFGESYKCG
jgi:hypothetical protein